MLHKIFSIPVDGYAYACQFCHLRAKLTQDPSKYLHHQGLSLWVNARLWLVSWKWTWLLIGRLGSEYAHYRVQHRWFNPGWCANPQDFIHTEDFNKRIACFEAGSNKWMRKTCYTWTIKLTIEAWIHAKYV